LAEALELFKLPRQLGQADNGDEVSVAIGRFGPFVKQGSTYASLKPEDDPYTIELPRALQIVAEKLEMLANRLILDFGNGVQVLNGRYGAYITDGEKNARIPKEQEPKELTEKQCLELLAAAPVRKGRFGKKGATKKAAAKKAAPVKKAAVKKPAAKKAAKTTAKKTATKKTAAKKAAATKKAAAKKAAVGKVGA
jgi:DNA topoisomerase-1